MPTRNLFTAPPRLPLIAPSILSADFAHLADECREALKHADLLHIDVMDGHFVPNLTMGPAVVASLRRALPEAFLDVHLMVTDPPQYVRPFAAAGANHITFHLEPSIDPHAGAGLSPLSQGYDCLTLAREIHAAGMTAGIALNPATPAETAKALLPSFDLVLVMSVNPGYSGQAFIPDVLAKTRTLKSLLRPDQRLEMDGGIAPENADRVREAGCDVLVAASAIFGRPREEWPGVTARLRGGEQGPNRAPKCLP